MNTATVDAGKVWMCQWCGRKTHSGDKRKIRHMRNCPVKTGGDSNNGEVKAFPASVFQRQQERCSKCGHRVTREVQEKKQ